MAFWTTDINTCGGLHLNEIVCVDWKGDVVEFSVMVSLEIEFGIIGLFFMS